MAANKGSMELVERSDAGPFKSEQKAYEEAPFAAVDIQVFKKEDGWYVTWERIIRGPVDKIDLKEFMDFGYLQEVNRQFLHPLGLALEVTINNDTGETYLSGVWDCRDDGEGIVFEEIDPDKVARVAKEWRAGARKRQEALGFVVQPVV